MPTRRPHQKSRHGCRPCKQRRVKCDEVRPVCANCRLREETCEYSAEASYIWAPEEKPRARSRKRKEPAPNHAEQPPSPASDVPFSLLDQYDGSRTGALSSRRLDLTQLRLLVNWQNATSQFFSRDTETRTVWQVHMVDEGLQSPPLMHGILAVSALHLALSEPAAEQASWLALATAHKGAALHALRENLSNITPEKAKFMMGLSALVVAYAFGSALTNIEDQPDLEALNNVFVLCRGVQQIQSAAGDYLRQSNFAPLFTPNVPAAVVPDHVTQSLDHLDELNTASLQGEEHDAATYTRVIAALRNLSAHSFAQPNSMTLAAGWAIRVTPEYLKYLQLQKPFALVVHAHYCAFLHLARGNCFIQNWGQSVLRDIIQLLDSSWIPHIQWPIQEVLGEGNLDEHR